MLIQQSSNERGRPRCAWIVGWFAGDITDSQNHVR
jgi:hypothetical protein